MKAIWTTKTGEKIPVCKMTDSHLLNSIACVERSYKRACLAGALAADSAYPDGEPDGAAMAAASEAAALFEEANQQEHIEERIPAFRSLLKEAEKRGLKLHGQDD